MLVKSIFDKMRKGDSKQKIYIKDDEQAEKAFENAIKKGMKEPEDWMYMHSTRFKDYFKHYDTRNYVSYFNFNS